ncbi:class I tRNA ligase family protein [Bradyrhizobium sp. NP1]|uniref:class I tRNA ligase family protein n=1 Tax=Bradyrhizobium sp. NP1 TaxID=3049772 RepID=UPI0025A506EB|nr:class I tRNA ligase family protein [Bradyrhizobium sp. NP1]WJR77629.1 class I tRNA ligase family protein [Bradyrhizobium sp. NP1]
MDVIKGFHWLTYEGGKFSTSARRGIFTDQALEELPADYWRWWLIANAPESADTDFNVERFVAETNKDLADIFGNLANRIISFAHRAFDGRIPSGGVPDETERSLAVELDQRIAALRAHHEALEFRAAAAATRAIWAAANAYVQRAAPWTAIRSDRARAAVVTRTGLNLVRLAAVLAWSIVPALSEDVLGAFGHTESVPRWPTGLSAPLLDAGAGTQVLHLQPLVAKITAEKAVHLAARFGG